MPAALVETLSDKRAGVAAAAAAAAAWLANDYWRGEKHI